MERERKQGRYGEGERERERERGLFRDIVVTDKTVNTKIHLIFRS